MKTIFEGYAFDCSRTPPEYCHQTIAIDDGQLLHSTDGKIRAIVPIEHAPEYVSLGWVADVGKDNQEMQALRGMHNPLAITDLEMK